MFELIKPRFSTEQWTLGHLIELYEADKLNLSPHYQRNSIWSLSAQRSLISTVLTGNAMPNFFVRSLPKNRLEWWMVSEKAVPSLDIETVSL